MNYYLLESLTAPPIVYVGHRVNIHIELVGFPEYLDRLQIVTDNGSHGILFKDYERWAGPVQNNLMQVIREDLAKSIPGSVIAVGPWESSSDNAVKIELVFNHFSGVLGKSTKIAIRWSIDKGQGQRKHGYFTDEQPIGDKYQDLIIGLNNGINNFSLELAKYLVAE